MLTSFTLDSRPLTSSGPLVLPFSFTMFSSSIYSQALLDGCFISSLSSKFQHSFSNSDFASYFTERLEAVRREQLQTPSTVSTNLLVSVSTYPALPFVTMNELCNSTERPFHLCTRSCSFWPNQGKRSSHFFLSVTSVIFLSLY